MIIGGPRLREYNGLARESVCSSYLMHLHCLSCHLIAPQANFLCHTRLIVLKESNQKEIKSSVNSCLPFFFDFEKTRLSSFWSEEQHPHFNIPTWLLLQSTYVSPLNVWTVCWHQGLPIQTMASEFDGYHFLRECQLLTTFSIFTCFIRPDIQIVAEIIQ